MQHILAKKLLYKKTTADDQQGIVMKGIFPAKQKVDKN